MSTLKVLDAASATITITLASLGTSSTRVFGRESTAVDNRTTRYFDALVSGKITTGTTPTVNKQIDIWVYAEHDDVPTYPDVLDGTDSDETLTSAEVRNSALYLAHTIVVTATSDVVYWVKPFSVAKLLGEMPGGRWGLFITHDTAVNLNSTGGNHEWKFKGRHYESV